MVPFFTADQMVTPLTQSLIMRGKRDTMPANRMMEMPLPTPNSVICSPSHIRKAEPAVKDRTITRATQTPLRAEDSMRQ